MSMKVFMIIKFIEIFCAYLGMTTVLPFFVMRTRLKKQRMTEKLLMSFLVGNFYLMNLVFLLQLLHISNRWTLLLGTIIPALAVWIRLNHVHVLEKTGNAWETLRKLATGHVSGKRVVYRLGKRIFKRIQWMVAYLGKAFLKHPLEWLLVLGDRKSTRLNSSHPK